MKVRLLRKRFYWYREPNNQFWCFYDKKHNVTHTAFVNTFYYINDMLIYRMLERMGIKDMFKLLIDRINSRKRERYNTELKRKFHPMFK